MYSLINEYQEDFFVKKSNHLIYIVRKFMIRYSGLDRTLRINFYK